MAATVILAGTDWTGIPIDEVMAHQERVWADQRAERNAHREAEYLRMWDRLPAGPSGSA